MPTPHKGKAMTPTEATQRRTQALEQLHLAALNRAACTHAYRTALRAAAESGATYTEIGNALGITRQSARQLILRCPR